METSREDIGIAIRSAFLSKGTQQKFSLLALILLSIVLLFVETIEIKPLNYLRSFLKDSIYRGSIAVSLPSKALKSVMFTVENHMNIYKQYYILAVWTVGTIIFFEKMCFLCTNRDYLKIMSV